MMFSIGDVHISNCGELTTHRSRKASHELQECLKYGIIIKVQVSKRGLSFLSKF